MFQLLCAILNYYFPSKTFATEVNLVISFKGVHNAFDIGLSRSLRQGSLCLLGQWILFGWFLVSHSSTILYSLLTGQALNTLPWKHGSLPCGPNGKNLIT